MVDGGVSILGTIGCSNCGSASGGDFREAIIAPLVVRWGNVCEVTPYIQAPLVLA